MATPEKTTTPAEAPKTETPAAAPASDAKPGKGTKQVSATIDQALYAELTEIRWAVKADKFSDLVAQALAEFAVKHAVSKA